jgi:lipoprotein-anchoring transpeptidase ErfK/SrfK
MGAVACGCAALAGAVALTLPTAAAPAAGQEPASAGVTRWAYVVRGVTAREAPRRTAPAVTVLRSATPEGESNLVRVLELRGDAALQDWVRVQLAILPHASTGWVPRWGLGALHAVRTRLVIDRKRFQAVLWRSGEVVFRAPIGVGQPRWPTPRGDFYVRQKLARFDDPFYGPIAFGTSARSRVLTDWPGGGYVGIHGTDRPELIPGRISHGCIRLRNADVLRLARLMPLGTPITID